MSGVNSWEKIADLKSTVPGPPGPQGRDGGNAVANDTANAGYLTTPGASASKDAISVDSWATKQVFLYGQALQKLRAKQAVTLVARGDSITYGHDTVSGDIVAAPPEALPDGSYHTVTRVPSPWPTVLQSRLREAYNYNGITVVNQGYSGDYVKRSYERWLNTANASLTMYLFGQNDAVASWIPAEYKGNVPQFIQWMERMILRDLAWGSAVVIVAPIKNRSYSTDFTVDVFRESLHALAAKYSIPFVDGNEFLHNYSSSVFADDVHPNTAGHLIIGTRIAACLMGAGPHRPAHVGAGSVLLARPQFDNFLLGAGMIVQSGTGSGVADESTTGGITVVPAAADADGRVYWSFYTDRPDTHVIPLVFLSNTGAGIGYFAAELDFGIAQPTNTHRLVVGKVTAAAAPSALASKSSAVAETLTNVLASGNTAASIKGSNTPLSIQIATPGWHTIRVTLRRSASGVTVFCGGLQFESFRGMYLQSLMPTV